MATKFSAQQTAVIEDRGGNLLVSAAAGSGKTTVLVERIMQYLQDPVLPANLDDFLIITYTKAAASELRSKIADRLSSLIAENPENVHLKRQVQRLYLAGISTVHSFCTDLLRQYAYRLDIPMDFRVADETECNQLKQDIAAKVLEQAYAQADTDPDFCAFTDTQGIGRNDKGIPDIVLKIYEASRCHLNPDAWLDDCLHYSTLDNTNDLSKTPWGEYLISTLKNFLSMELDAYDTCIEAVKAYSQYEKIAALLENDRAQAQELLDSPSWDAFVSNSNLVFGRFTAPRKDNPAPELLEQVKAVRDSFKDELAHYTAFFTEDTAQIIADSVKLASSSRGLIALVRSFATEFARVKLSKRVLDFSDLEQRTLDLLLGKSRSGVTSVAKEIALRYREVMVDEYQDSNQVQDGIFSALTSEQHNCFMVGDIKQSIYRFRLAEPGIFLDKYHRYLPQAEAQHGQDRKILLSSNYRSGGGILKSVNDVFAYCMTEQTGGLNYGPEESLYEGIPHLELPDAEVELYAIEADSEAYATEAEFVASRIVELLDGQHFVRDHDALRPIQAGDIAILLRSPSTNGLHFQKALSAKGIPIFSESGEDLLKTEEIETLRALLICISNPRQDIPLISVLCSPFFGFTADDLAGVRVSSPGTAFYDALRSSTLEKAQHFTSLLQSYRQKSQSENLSTLLSYIYTSLQLEDIYRMRPDGAQKQKNLRQFYQKAVDYENGGRRDLDMFLHYLESQEEKGINIGSDNSNQNAVILQSIHKSKGLEYPVVFLCGLSKVFNKESTRGRVLCDKELGIGLSIADEQKNFFYPSTAREAIAEKEARESLSEEMRVLYVAMTRARDRLIMTFTKNNLEKYFTNLISRYAIESPQLLSSKATCMGDWIMLSALARTEAGEFFQFGSKYHETHPGDPEWHINVITNIASQTGLQTSSDQKIDFPEEAKQLISRGLTYTYPHEAAVAEPSKQTATQQKGRHKDEEAAANADPAEKPVFQWKKHQKTPSSRGKEYGTVVHRAIQFLDYSRSHDFDSVKENLLELVDREILTREEYDSLRISQIAAFYSGPIPKRMQHASEVLQEFKFSILESAEKNDPRLAGEQVLMQGVVDLAIVEPDGIVIVDFKTDKVSDYSEKVEQYRPQVQTYASALERIYELPVKEKYLFFFHTGELIPV